MTELFKTFGEIAGIGGFALGVLLFIYRDVIRKNIFSTLGEKNSYELMRLIIILVFVIAVIGIAALITIQFVNGKQVEPPPIGSPPIVKKDTKKETVKTPIILVPAFENISGKVYEVKRDDKMVDRYSETSRTILEDILAGIPNIKVAERQQWKKILIEYEFSRKSGLVDPKYAIEVGNLLGANIIIMGTIADINEENLSFKGYGIQTQTKVISATLRIRVIDIASGQILLSKEIEGRKNLDKTDFGEIKNNDAAIKAIQNALNKLRNDQEFLNAIALI